MTVEITGQRTAASYDILFEALNVADALTTVTLNTSADGKSPPPSSSPTRRRR